MRHFNYFSDVDGLYNKSKNIVRTVNKIDESVYSLIDRRKNIYGSGGISTKLDAAKICMNAGCHMFIANGNKRNPIETYVKTKIYTKFFPKISALDARERWIISSLNSYGTIYIDKGAANALKNGKSLLAAGIKMIDGEFDKGDNVVIADEEKRH